MSTSDGPESTENENGLSLSSMHTRESFSSSLHISIVQLQGEMSRNIRFPTMWYVRPAKAQTSLRIRAV